MEDWREKVDEIDDMGINLTEWEIQFVEDMLEKSRDPFFTPTQRQLDKLDAIYDERM